MQAKVKTNQTTTPSTEVKRGPGRPPKVQVVAPAAPVAEKVRKKAFGPRSLRSHYSMRESGLTVRAWVGQPDILIRDDRGVEVDIPEEELDGLIQSLIDLRSKKQRKEVK